MSGLSCRAVVATLALACLSCGVAQATPPPFQILPDRSVARNWSEALIFALRRDSGRVAYNARVVFQFAVAVYDAWAVYDADARPYLLGNNVNGFDCAYDPGRRLEGSPAAQRVAISYAAYRYLRHRFGDSVNAKASLAVFDELMQHYGLDPGDASVDYQRDPSPAALGNYIGDCVIRFGLGDGSNEANGYRTRFYKSVNPPLDPTDPHSIDHVVNPDRWQKLALAVFVSKTGQPGPAPEFETPEWGFTSPFGMTAKDRRVFHRDGAEYWVYHDPGKPALISGIARQRSGVPEHDSEAARLLRLPARRRSRQRTRAEPLHGAAVRAPARAARRLCADARDFLGRRSVHGRDARGLSHRSA
jgi:hypothetical protein